VIIEHKSPSHTSTLALARFAARVRHNLRLEKVNVLLTDDAEIRQLNRRFRKKDKPTDVLSFPAIAQAGGGFAGDIAISIDYATRSAQRFGLSLQDELKILILHGMIHLAGHDHERDRGEMAQLETRLRRKLGLPTGLISRAESEDGIPRSKRKVASPSSRRSTMVSRTSAQPRRPQGGVQS